MRLVLLTVVVCLMVFVCTAQAKAKVMRTARAKVVKRRNVQRRRMRTAKVQRRTRRRYARRRYARRRYVRRNMASYSQASAQARVRINRQRRQRAIRRMQQRRSLTVQQMKREKVRQNMERQVRWYKNQYMMLEKKYDQLKKQKSGKCKTKTHSTSGVFSHPVTDKHVKEAMEHDTSYDELVDRDDTLDSDEKNMKKKLHRMSKRYNDIYSEFDALNGMKLKDLDFETTSVTKKDLVRKIRRFVFLAKKRYRGERNPVLLARLLRLHSMLKKLSKGDSSYTYNLPHRDVLTKDISKLLKSEDYDDDFGKHLLVSHATLNTPTIVIGRRRRRARYNRLNDHYITSSLNFLTSSLLPSRHHRVVKHTIYHDDDDSSSSIVHQFIGNTDISPHSYFMLSDNEGNDDTSELTI